MTETINENFSKLIIESQSNIHNEVNIENDQQLSLTQNESSKEEIGFFKSFFY